MEQEPGLRKFYVSEKNGELFGYATLLQQAPDGPFMNLNISEIVDFNVLLKFQRQGIGSAILNAIENNVSVYSSQICLKVGLQSGHGPAQRLYVKRGYMPDGSGVWYGNHVATPYTEYCNDDEFILYFSKQRNYPQ